MQRYFGQIITDQVLLGDDDIFHLTKVMRARVGDEIEVVSNEKVFLCKVSQLKPHIEIDVVKQIKENHELKNHVILIAALIKGEKMDFVLQKATELGVGEIVLLQTERTIVKIKPAEKDLKLERYRRILKEAAEQCKRTKIPMLYRVIDIKQLGDVDAQVKMIAYEEESGATESFNSIIRSIKDKQKVAIVVGPEGGFSEHEVDMAVAAGYKRVSLGKRILRAETASFYALCVISNHLERK
ncbi:MAG: 16S rRNA (uracil(1498)-N(3))-methyltransferase [Bacilli bacterium]|nr:16S rRNA (uracil(1498)-N(3))-methyltransferase [Bacilli bacterium]